jgi:phosphatidylglycerol lysyltransferase
MHMHTPLVSHPSKRVNTLVVLPWQNLKPKLQRSIVLPWRTLKRTLLTQPRAMDALATQMPPSACNSTILDLGLPSTEVLTALAGANADPRAWLALQHDKQVLTDSKRNLLLYANTSEYAIALRGVLGTPHMRPEQQHSMLQEFMRIARAQHRHAIFYQADAATLAAVNAAARKPYRAYKLGEEAVLDLTHYSLNTPEFSGVRQSVRKAEKSGLVFEFCPHADAALLARCQFISLSWLRRRRAREKRFSLGRFYLPALLNQPLALVWQGDELLAFANVLRSADQSTLSVDLMRHTEGVPRGTMDLLFARLLDWGKAQGYTEFSFGMCPLKDVAADAAAHSGRWVDIAGHVSRHGERFYNFRGMRQFKEKWQPQWRPRYLLVPARRHALPALIACAVEIAGGVGALFRTDRA